MPDGKITVHVLLDFTKAFDIINHGLFIHKLGSRYDLHTSAIGMVSSFLRAPRHVHCLLVVPQGCTSSTLFFFSMFIKDLCLCIRFSKFLFYVDDLQIYLSGDRKR
jgi:hypothetical protein